MTDILQTQVDKILRAGAWLLSPGSILSVPAVALALVMAVGFLLWRHWRRRRRVRPAVVARALLGSRRVISHRSTRADLFYYFVNTFAIGGMIGWGTFSAIAVAGLVVHGLDARLGVRAAVVAPDWVLRAGITVVAFVGYELGYYIDHRLKHRVPVLWEFHKTHHSAEVLTPLTVFRVHPVDSLIFVDIVALVAGGLYGVFTWAVGRNVGIIFVAHGNVITVACLLLLAQLQHSQFWMPLRGVAGRLVLSPAHHQLHHSSDPAHYNCNFGSFIGVWDWMFGTLRIPPRESPRLRFGVAQASGEPHRIMTLLVDPVVNAVGVVRRRFAGPD